MAKPPVLLSAGSNARGQLASGSSDDLYSFSPCIFSDESVTVLGNARIISVASGANHTLLLVQQSNGRHSLLGVGDGTKCQLGTRYMQGPGTSEIFIPLDVQTDCTSLQEDWEPIQIAASWETSFIAISGTGGNVYILCLGTNEFGELGAGDNRNRHSCLVDFADVLPENKGQVKVADIKAGQRHVIVKLQIQSSDQMVGELTVGWGACRHGQLGSLASPDPKARYAAPQIVEVQNVDTFTLGSRHSVFLLHSGELLGIGANSKGQLNGTTSMRNVVNLTATWNGTYCIVDRGETWTLYGAGSNTNSQLASPPSISTESKAREIQVVGNSAEYEVKRLCSGTEHVLVLLRSRTTGSEEIWAWGWNEHGNLGVGNTTDVINPRRIWPAEGHAMSSCRIEGVWGGCGTTWIALRPT